YFGARRPDDGRIDWSRPAGEVYNLIRAVAPPYPGAFCEVAGRRLVIAKARLASPLDASGPRPAAGLHVAGDRILGICGDGAAVIALEIRDEHDRAPLSLEALRSLLAADRAASP
ncbi:MAG TPA: formyltransferase, partial [Caldimonas sp.]|nr:formyltransferase [Caldimonas sp.]